MFMSEQDCHKLRTRYDTRARVQEVLRICAGARMSKFITTTAGLAAYVKRRLGAGVVEAALLLVLLVLSGSQHDAWLLPADCRLHSSYKVGKQHKIKGIGVVVSARFTNTKLRILERKSQPLQTNGELFSLHIVDCTKGKPLSQHCL